MKYAVERNSTQEIINWFKNFIWTRDCDLNNYYKYLVYCPSTNDSYYAEYLKPNIHLLTPEEFTKKIIKKENMKEITYEQAQSIIDIACDSWKEKLFHFWGKRIIYKTSIDIEKDFYKEMRKACTKEQHELFDKIFGKDNIPKKGTLVYVSKYKKEWLMRYYSHYEQGEHHCFNNQDKKSEYTTVWNNVSLTNPLLEEPQFV